MATGLYHLRLSQEIVTHAVLCNKVSRNARVPIQSPQPLIDAALGNRKVWADRRRRLQVPERPCPDLTAPSSCLSGRRLSPGSSCTSQTSRVTLSKLFITAADRARASLQLGVLGLQCADQLSPGNYDDTYLHSTHFECLGLVWVKVIWPPLRNKQHNNTTTPTSPPTPSLRPINYHILFYSVISLPTCVSLSNAPLVTLFDYKY